MFFHFVKVNEKILWRYASNEKIGLKQVYPPKTTIVSRVVPMEEVMQKHYPKIVEIEEVKTSKIKTTISYQEAVKNVEAEMKNKNKLITESEKSEKPEFTKWSTEKKHEILDNLYKTMKN